MRQKRNELKMNETEKNEGFNTFTNEIKQFFKCKLESQQIDRF